MRGKQLLDHVVWHSDRLIPACAGKTQLRGSRWAVHWAHPRVCGENPRASPSRTFWMGSSPRMRGKPTVGVSAYTLIGLIPAYAGKTRFETARASGSRAHPRVCGENCAWCLMWAGRGGSSPRMRGKRSWTVTSVGRSGLIPAYAEKTTPAWSGPFLPRAHPRVCGENWNCCGSTLPPSGSSPRMRGKLAGAQGGTGADRLIPAYAGKTPDLMQKARTRWAHPRVCGENRAARTRARLAKGSSPRMRGKQKLPASSDWIAGLIPAYAGKTFT